MHAMHAMHVKQNASADEVLMMSDVGGKVSHIQEARDMDESVSQSVSQSRLTIAGRAMTIMMYKKYGFSFDFLDLSHYSHAHHPPRF
jgi:hypothetical protein